MKMRFKRGRLHRVCILLSKDSRNSKSEFGAFFLFATQNSESEHPCRHPPLFRNAFDIIKKPVSVPKRLRELNTTVPTHLENKRTKAE